MLVPLCVTTWVTGFGSTESVEYISPFPQQIRTISKKASYYIKLIKTLESIGYTRNVDIRAAPYDWRQAPNEHEEFFVQLKLLVEETYYLNGYKPVIFFTHSMGAIVFAATPWGGNFKYMYDYLYSDDFAGNILPIFRKAERTFSSLAFLLPNRRIFGDSVLIQTPRDNFTASDFGRFFAILNHKDAFNMWIDTRDILDPLVHPQVDIFCIGGINVPTLRAMICKDEYFTKQMVIYANGDGFVNMESLMVTLLRRQISFNGYF
ncbi:group XV phospholipase A2-like protein [Dinothrombium tinctorium]|uniref:Group XV phospholipase A2-like protein n=1 Tax=Dinothrombium tinctorium TaxID=1965070 RepID=A0A443RMU4_9ACAR|nr:group XV phospholipase A2-like protein [Dinothrombium tinctorium]